MLISLKDNLKFDHSTGKILFKYKKPEDLLILPVPENLRIIGKITRYYVFYMLYSIDSHKAFGKNYFYVKKGINKKIIYISNEEEDKGILQFDYSIGTLIYLLILLIILALRKEIITIMLIFFIFKLIVKYK